MKQSIARIAVLTVGLLVAPIEKTFAAVITTAAAPGQPQASVRGTGSAFQTDTFGAARAFAIPATGATGVAVQVNSPLTVPYQNDPQGFATAFWSDAWQLQACPGCVVIPGETFRISNRVGLSGTVDPIPALDNYTGFTFEEDIQFNFQLMYSFLFSIGPAPLNNPNVPFTISTGFVDFHLFTTHVSTGTPVPVTVNGNHVSVDFTIPVDVPVSYTTTVTVLLGANTNVDFYDPIQAGFTSSDPTIQFVSDAGNSTNAGSVPEPASIVLLTAGLTFLGMVRLRRRMRTM